MRRRKDERRVDMVSRLGAANRRKDTGEGDPATGEAAHGPDAERVTQELRRSQRKFQTRRRIRVWINSLFLVLVVMILAYALIWVVSTDRF